MKETAINAAKEAGKIIKENFRKEKEITFKDKIGNDLVTHVDLLCEKKIVSIIKKKFPDHNIISEETKFEKNSSEYTWIIDPIDGTKNFASEIPLFIVGICLKKRDEIIMAVCYDPIHDELFYAEKGKGAFLNNKKINVSQKQLQNATVALSWIKKDPISFYATLQREISIVINYRSCILHLCYIACGRIDGCLINGLYLWDYAPFLLVKEAGGKVTKLDGSHFSLDSNNILVTNGIIHNDILKIITQEDTL